MIENPSADGPEIVVAGGKPDGLQTSEILSLSALTWREGPRLPRELFYVKGRET